MNPNPSLNQTIRRRRSSVISLVCQVSEPALQRGLAARRRVASGEAVKRADNVGIESQIAGFLAKYTPAIEAQLRETRARLRALFPRGFELAYDNYNALVFGISATGRTADSFLSIAGYARRWLVGGSTELS